jgi:hypothetical protein
MPVNSKRPLTLLATAAAALVLLLLPATAQWLKIPSNVPKGKDGKPDLSAPAPKLPDGKPDFSGIWQAAGPKWLRSLAGDLNPETLPFLPAGRALFNQRKDGSQAKYESDAQCLPQGVPKINATPVPFKLVQMPGYVVILYEAFNLWRQVFLDGRELAPDPNPTWLGYSVGRYEGDSLVVETTGFNGKTWLDQLGLPQSDSARVTERFRRKDFGHLEITVTIDDPKSYTKPWTVVEEANLLLNTELMEFICNENEKDQPHMPVGKQP